MPQNDLEQPQSADVSSNEVYVSDETNGAEESTSDALAPSVDPSTEDVDSESDEFSKEMPFEGEIDTDDDVEPKQSSYLDDDDEAILASSDTLLHSDGSLTIAQQEEAVVKWDIQGLYDERGRVRSKRSLKNNPPVFVVSDSNGEEATFILTKELSAALARNFENANRAYYGIKPRGEMKFKDKLGEAKQGLRENMGKAIVIGGLLLGLLIFGIFF